MLSSYVSADGDEQSTSLLHACYLGKIETVKSLIAKGVNPNASLENGNTALIIAIMNRHSNIAEFMIEQKVDINAKSESGGGAMVASILTNQPELARLLIENGVSLDSEPQYIEMSLVSLASMYGRSQIVEMLLKAGCDIKARDREGNTPLIYAADGDADCVTDGDLATVELLVKHGANINDKNYRGWTPLMCAAGNGDFEIVRLLSQHNHQMMKALVLSNHQRPHHSQ